MKRVAFALMFTIFFALPTRAQSDPTRLKLAIGDTVDVTERTGVITTGVLTNVTASAIEAGNREFPVDSILKVQRRGDSVWSGVLIGMGVGLLVSPGTAEGCLHGSKTPCVLLSMGVYGGFGALLDFAHEGKTTIYRAAATSGKGPHLAPMLSPGTKGLSMAFGF